MFEAEMQTMAVDQYVISYAAGLEVKPLVPAPKSVVYSYFGQRSYQVLFAHMGLPLGYC